MTIPKPLNILEDSVDDCPDQNLSLLARCQRGITIDS